MQRLDLVARQKRESLIPKQGAKGRADRPVLLSDRTLTEAFKDPDGTLTPLGKFVFYSRYSRWREEQGRREYWAETSQRSTEYNINLAIAFAEEKGIDTERFREDHQSELEALFDNQFNTRQALSGRTLWAGGTPASYDNPMSNFNCSFTVIDSWGKLGEIIHLGMVGSGIGFRILKPDVKKLKNLKVRRWDIGHVEYNPKAPEDRMDNSHLIKDGNTITIVIGDSKEGWRQAIDHLFDTLIGRHGDIKIIDFNYNNIRQKGERLKRFGGRAGGHETIKNMFDTFHKILNGLLVEGYPKTVNGNVKPIHVLDLVNAIGKNIVSGDVRSIAEIALLDADDQDTINAKTNIFTQTQLNHRFVSNNSVFYEKRPTDEQFDWQFQAIEFNGEPCFVNAVLARQRRDDFEGVNPCVEILLADRGLCNLTTVNMAAFVRDGVIDMVGLIKAFTLAARSGVRMTLPKLELPEWDRVQQRDRLIGVSMTGWMDFVDAAGIDADVEGQNELLEILKATVQGSAIAYCEQLGINAPLLETCVKPEGTQSQLFGGVSSGLHVAHAPTFLRRIRAATSDPIARASFEFDGWRTAAEFQDGSQFKQIDDLMQYVSFVDRRTIDNEDGIQPKKYEYQHGYLNVEVDLRINTETTHPMERDENFEKMASLYYETLHKGKLIDYFVEDADRADWVTLKYTVATDDFNTVFGKSSKIVVDFPQRSPAKNTKANFSAIKQLEVYKQFLHHYTNHNPSNTITVRPEEWGEVKQWVKDNWDDMLAVSFLTLYDAPYPLLPFQEVDEQVVAKLESEMGDFDVNILRKYDHGGDMEIEEDPDCVNGCPVR